MNKDEIKKAFECCISGICTDCPYYSRNSCRERLQLDAESLINGQEKEINFQVKDRARLQKEFDELELAYFQRVEELNYAKKDCDRAFQHIETQQIKQAKIDVLNELKEKYSTFGNTFARWIAFIPAADVDKMIEELKK